MATEQQSESRGQVRFLSTQQKAHEVSLVPYAKVNGVWTLDENILLSMARTCQQEGTFQTVFYDGHIRAPEDFLTIMQQPANVPVFAFRGTEPLGFAWLNGLSGNRAFGHFCMLNAARGKPAFEACQMFLDYWFSWMHAGEPILDIIIGVIPESNERAVRFVEKIGFSRLGAIPQMLSNAYTGDRVAAVILYYSRFEHGR